MNQDIHAIVFGQHCLNTLGQIRSLGEIGICPDVVWVSHDMHSPRGSRYINSFHRLDSFEAGLEYIKDHYSLAGEKSFIFTDSDEIVSLLNCQFDSLNDRFHFFNAGTGRRLLKFMPKYEMCHLASKHGFVVPKSELVRNGDFPEALNYPIFTKSPDSNGMSWKDNSFICRNRTELEDAFKRINTGTVLLQEFIEKENEIAIEGISYHCGEDVFFPIQGEYLRVQDGGFGTWKKNQAYCLGDDLHNRICGLMREIKYNGVFEIEFLKDKKGILYFLEINFRFTQYNYALTRMGFNLCEEYIRSEIDRSYSPSASLFSPQLVMNDPKDFRTYVATGRISFAHWLKDMRKSDSYYLFNRNDKLYVVRYLFTSIYKRLINRVKGILN